MTNINSILGTESRKVVRFGERLRAIFDSILTDELTAEAVELIRRRRILDFTVQPGKASAKINDEQSRAQRIEVRFARFSDEAWEAIFDQMADQAYFMAKLLNARVPVEAEQLMREHGCELLPDSPDKLPVFFSQARLSELNPAAAAVLLRLCERLESDPISLFTLRGRGPDEIIAELQRKRSLLKEKPEFESSLSYHQVAYEPAPPLRSTVNYFWSSGAKLKELSYTIRADELPASILKWLDPIPLSGLEEHVDYRFEEAYERVARLAQGYGLGL